jgi:hypothetical protein
MFLSERLDVRWFFDYQEKTYRQQSHLRAWQFDQAEPEILYQFKRALQLTDAHGFGNVAVCPTAISILTSKGN